MSAADASSLSLWSVLSLLGLILVIFGVILEGAEAFIWTSSWLRRQRFSIIWNTLPEPHIPKWTHRLDHFGWFILVLGLALETWGHIRVTDITGRENRRLTSKLDSTTQIAGDAINQASSNAVVAAQSNAEAGHARLDAAEAIKQAAEAGERAGKANKFAAESNERAALAEKAAGRANVLAANVESTNVHLSLQVAQLVSTNLELEKQVLVFREQIDETRTNIANLEPTNQSVFDISASVVLFSGWPTFWKLFSWRLSDSAEMTLCEDDRSRPRFASLIADDLTDAPLFPDKIKTPKGFHTYRMHFHSKVSVAQAFGFVSPAKSINDVKFLRIDANFIPRGAAVMGFASVTLNNSFQKRFLILPKRGTPNFPNAIIATNLDLANFPQLK